MSARADRRATHCRLGPAPSSESDWSCLSLTTRSFAEVGNTAPDPSYPGAHAVISAAAASVLSAFFGHKPFHFSVTSEVLPGVERSFDNIAAAAQEASLSRVYAGVHFRSDENAGEQLGAAVADFVLGNLLTPVSAAEER